MSRSKIDELKKDHWNGYSYTRNPPTRADLFGVEMYLVAMPFTQLRDVIMVSAKAGYPPPREVRELFALEMKERRWNGVDRRVVNQLVRLGWASFGSENCPACTGTGKYRHPQNSMNVYPCYDCGGSGKVATLEWKT